MNSIIDDKTSSALETESLLQILATYTDSNLGREAVLNLSPLPDQASANREIQRVGLLRRYLAEEGSFDFYWFKHIEPSFFDYKAKHSVMEAELLFTTAKTLREASANQQLLEAASEEDESYNALASLLIFPDWIPDDILDSIDSDGSILDSASPELARMRQEYRRSRERINSNLKKFFGKGDYPDFVQDEYITIRNDRAVIPIKVEKKNQYKGIIHDRSRSGDSVYFEPMEVVELNNSLANLRAEIRLEEARVLARLTATLYTHWEDVTTVFRNTAYLESLLARARFAEITQSVPPEIGDHPEFRITEARHPLIDEKLNRVRANLRLDDEYSSNDVVPVDIIFNKEHQVLVVTGPNAGGKTVTLKTAGLLAVMAQSGMHVPAKQYIAPFFRTIASDIGDYQDILSHLSSFSSHLYWLRNTIQDMTQPSLILIDEIAAATDPGEGSALAMATLEYLRDSEAYVMASTHLEALKAFAHTQQGMQNCSVEFDPETLKPTYNLRYGLPGKSNALETAREMKLPGQLLKRAHYYMGDEGASISEIVTSLQEQLSELQKEKDAAAAEKARMEKARQHYVNKLDKAQEQANREIDKIRKEWKEYRRKHDKALQEALELARNNAAEAQVREKMRDAINTREEEFDALKLNKKTAQKRVKETTPLEKGATVELKGTGQKGVVDKAWKGGKGPVSVNFSGKRMTVPRESLQSAQADKKPSGSGVQIQVHTESKQPETELVLVGKRIDEAISELDRFIDNALVNHFETVRVVHGRGTGKLRRAVEEHLRNHPMVASWRLADQVEGGNAVTVATLNN